MTEADDPQLKEALRGYACRTHQVAEELATCWTLRACAAW
jgi:hypothetical protein